MRTPSIAVCGFLYLDLELVETFGILARFVKAFAGKICHLLEVKR